MGIYSFIKEFNFILKLSLLHFYNVPPSHGLCVIMSPETTQYIVNPHYSRSQYGTRCSQLSTYFKEADESLARSNKTWQFLQTCNITFTNKYNF
jgi:hypothetical protein